MRSSVEKSVRASNFATDPPTLISCCYTIAMQPTTANMEPGHSLILDGIHYPSVRGECRPENLDGCTRSSPTRAGARLGILRRTRRPAGWQQPRPRPYSPPRTDDSDRPLACQQQTCRAHNDEGIAVSIHEGVNGDEAAAPAGCRCRCGPAKPANRSTRPAASCILRPSPDGKVRELTRPGATNATVGHVR